MMGMLRRVWCSFRKATSDIIPHGRRVRLVGAWDYYECPHCKSRMATQRSPHIVGPLVHWWLLGQKDFEDGPKPTAPRGGSSNYRPTETHVYELVDIRPFIRRFGVRGKIEPKDVLGVEGLPEPYEPWRGGGEEEGRVCVTLDYIPGGFHNEWIVTAYYATDPRKGG